MLTETKKNVVDPSSLNEYQNLLAGISRIFEEAKDSTLISINKIRNRAYWLIGERIVKVEQKGEIRAQYGARLIEHLARDLGFKYKNGFSESNLRMMRQFFLSHPIQHPGVELSWSHHKLLLSIRDAEKRRYYERMCLEKHWSKRDLRNSILNNKIEIDKNAKISRDKEERNKIESLPLTKGKLFTYQLVDLNLPPEGNLLVVDCGFKILRRVLTDKVYLFSKDEIIETVKNRDEWKIQKSFLGKDCLHTYKAYVEKVVDGDTLVAQIDCGFDTWVNQRLRLKSIDCPSLDTRKGQKAKIFLEKTLKRVGFIVIRTFKSDKYDHYLVDVFYLPGEKDPAVVADRGHFLNQELIDRKLAVGVRY